MTRKWNISKILDDDEIGSSNSNQPSTAKIMARTRAKVLCYCNKCDGKLVDSRTKNTHEEKMESTSDESEFFNTPNSFIIKATFKFNKLNFFDHENKEINEKKSFEFG